MAIVIVSRQCFLQPALQTPTLLSLHFPTLIGFLDLHTLPRQYRRSFVVVYQKLPPRRHVGWETRRECRDYSRESHTVDWLSYSHVAITSPLARLFNSNMCLLSARVSLCVWQVRIDPCYTLQNRMVYVAEAGRKIKGTFLFFSRMRKKLKDHSAFNR